MNNYLALALIQVFWFLVAVMAAYCYNHHKKKILQRRQKELLVDLELATSDQLLEEYRKRLNNPYLIIRPLKRDENMTTLTIETHELSPMDVVAILSLSAEMTRSKIDEDGGFTCDEE